MFSPHSAGAHPPSAPAIRLLLLACACFSYPSPAWSLQWSQSFPSGAVGGEIRCLHRGTVKFMHRRLFA